MEIVNWIKGLLVDYGAMNVVIMLLTIFITNLIKKPIIDHAADFVSNARKLTGLEVDKSVITSNIVYIPVGVAFVLYFIYTVLVNKFNFYVISWTSLVSDSVVYGMLSMSIYEIGKAKLKSYVGQKTYKEAKEQIAQITKPVDNGDLLVQNITADNTPATPVEPAEGIVEAPNHIIKEN